MSTLTKVQHAKSILPKEHRSVSHFVEHALASIDALVEQQREYNAAQALYGDKINGVEVTMFHETVAKVKEALVETLEKTAEDFSHKGDKYWHAHYKDGVE
jgi:O-succinylbenzoate synthase